VKRNLIILAFVLFRQRTKKFFYVAVKFMYSGRLSKHEDAMVVNWCLATSALKLFSLRDAPAMAMVLPDVKPSI
jgi:hypothetical protein